MQSSIEKAIKEFYGMPPETVLKDIRVTFTVEMGFNQIEEPQPTTKVTIIKTSKEPQINPTGKRKYTKTRGSSARSFKAKGQFSLHREYTTDPKDISIIMNHHFRSFREQGVLNRDTGEESIKRLADKTPTTMTENERTDILSIFTALRDYKLKQRVSG